MSTTTTQPSTTTEPELSPEDAAKLAQIEASVDFFADSLVVPGIVEGDLKRGIRFYTPSARHMGSSLVNADRAARGAYVVSLREQGFTMNAIVEETGMSKATCRRLINEALLADELGDVLAEAGPVATTAVAA